tara:strand:- start:291 stop:503 length:213 start_codon:yes stop_codon:yes gene_type:complete
LGGDDFDHHGAGVQRGAAGLVRGLGMREHTDLTHNQGDVAMKIWTELAGPLALTTLAIVLGFYTYSNLAY